MKRRPRDQALATVLFTDIVGSTRIASELGDRRWRVLLSHHRRIVREELKRFDGREVDTAGDGFYAVFDEPSRALRCAAATSTRTRELGIEIRAGMNFGETESIEGKPGGVAVHAASRIMSMAAAGEVLVSSTVRDLVPGSGFSFEDRGTHELRDVPGEWRIFALAAVDGTQLEPPAPSEEAAERRDAIEPPPLLQRRSGRIGAIAVVVVVVGATVVIPLSMRHQPAASPSPAPSALGDRLVRIDPGEGVTAEFAVGDHPAGVAFGEGSVWVTNANDGTVTRIDPATRRATTIPVGSSPGPIVVGAGAVWVGNTTAGTVSRIDPATNTTETIDLDVGVGDRDTMVAVDDETGSVWAGARTEDLSSKNVGDFHVWRIDPTTASATKIADVGCCFAGALAGGAGSIWLATDDGTVVRYDARTGHVLWRANHALAYYAIGVDATETWLGSATFDLRQGPAGNFQHPRVDSGGAISPVASATNELGDTISLGGAPTGIALLDGGVYVSDVLGVVHPYVGGAVLKEIPIGGHATGIAAGQGFLWVSVNEP